MEDITVPIIPVEKEDQIAKKIIKASARAPEEPVWNAESVKIGNEEYDCTEDVELVLLGMGMEKYVNVLLKSEVSLQTFLQLDESDLRELGITDMDDMRHIAENLKIFQEKQKKFEISDSPVDDLQIARNISNELMLLENYCKYLELQMRRRKLTDYRINLNESASTYLKAFAKVASIQAKILTQRFFQNSKDASLIKKALKINNLDVELYGKEKLKKKKPEGRKIFSRVTIILGILSLILLSLYTNQRKF